VAMARNENISIVEPIVSQDIMIRDNNSENNLANTNTTNISVTTTSDSVESSEVNDTNIQRRIRKSQYAHIPLPPLARPSYNPIIRDQYDSPSKSSKSISNESNLRPLPYLSTKRVKSLISKIFTSTSAMIAAIRIGIYFVRKLLS
jgi:hypothetical protein